jgi:hypothetical protein
MKRQVRPKSNSHRCLGRARESRLDCMSPVVASMYCSPHPAALHIAPAARLRGFCLYDSAPGDLFRADCDYGWTSVNTASASGCDGSCCEQLRIIVYKPCNFCDIYGVVSKTRPRAVRTFGVPILTAFSFSRAAVKTVLPASTDSSP